MPKPYVQKRIDSELFHRKNYRLLLTVAIVLLGIILLMVFGLIYLQLSIPQEEYFVTTTAGQVLEIQPN